MRFVEHFIMLIAYCVVVLYTSDVIASSVLRRSKGLCDGIYAVKLHAVLFLGCGNRVFSLRDLRG